MLGNAFSGWHLLIIAALLLLLFGAAKLPGLAKSVGQSMRVFRSEVRTMKEENADPTDKAAETVRSEVPSTDRESQPKP